MSISEVTNPSTQVEARRLTTTVGEPTSSHGRTHVVLYSTGRFEAHLESADAPEPGMALRTERKGEPEHFVGEVSRGEAERLLGIAAAFPWTRRFPNRPGIPDEAIVEWTLVGPNDEHGHVRVWLRDAEKEMPFATVIEALRAHLDRVSGGKLYL